MGRARLLSWRPRYPATCHPGGGGVASTTTIIYYLGHTRARRSRRRYGFANAYIMYTSSLNIYGQRWQRSRARCRSSSSSYYYIINSHRLVVSVFFVIATIVVMPSRTAVKKKKKKAPQTRDDDDRERRLVSGDEIPRCTRPGGVRPPPVIARVGVPI